MVSYKIANSPKLSAINCASKPSGGQTFLNQWLNKSAEAPLSVPSGLVRCIFDNNQVIGKRYRVKANKTSVPASVITSHACIMIDSNNHVQYQEKYQPSNWLYQGDSKAATNILDSFHLHDDLFLATQNRFVESKIQNITEELSSCSDPIDELVKEKEMMDSGKFCSSCQNTAPISDRVCKVCRGKLP